MAKARKATKNRTEDRPQRIPMSGGARSILEVFDKNPDFRYRWVNDTEGRIQRFLAASYEFERGDVVVGEKHADSAVDPDSMVTKKVGGGITAYLMKLHRKYAVQDDKAKAAEVDASEEALFRELNKQGGNYGEVNFSRDK